MSTAGRDGTRRGLTLIELIVVIAILGIGALVAGVSFPRPETAALIAPGACPDSLDGLIRQLGMVAVMSGRRVSRVVWVNESLVHVTAVPDGRVMTSLGCERT